MNAILSTKTKNQIKALADAAGMDLEYSLKNISLNGVKTGCSGFIRNPRNGSTVYLSTEPPRLSTPKYLFRYADGTRDYTGYHNRFANTPEELARNIVELLKKTPQEAGDYRL